LIRNSITGSSADCAQLNVTDDIVETPQLIVALNIGLTVIVNVVVVAHCPAVGVNV
jgi:hypothetical protein